MALRIHQLRGIRLDRLGNVELASHRAALPHEEVFADQRLPGLQRVSPGLLHHLRDAANFRKIQNHRHVVKAAKRQRDLADVRVPGALSHAVNRSLNPRRAASHRGYPACCRHSKIIVTVEMHGHLRPHPLASLPDQKFPCFRSTRPDGIDHNDLSRARFQHSHVNLAQEVEIRPRSIDRKKCDCNPILLGKRDCLRNAPKNIIAREAVRLQLDITGRGFDDRSTQTQPDELLHIGFQRAREPPQFRLQSGPLQQLNRFGIFG